MIDLHKSTIEAYSKKRIQAIKIEKGDVYFGRLFEKLRILSCFSVSELSDKIGFTDNHIRAIETNKRRPSESYVDCFCNALEVDKNIISFFCNDKELRAALGDTINPPPLIVRKCMLSMLTELSKRQEKKKANIV